MLQKFALFCWAMLLVGSVNLMAKAKPKILVYSKTTGFRHGSIGVGKIALIDLGKKHGFDVDTTEDVQAFTPGNLQQYATIVFLSPTGENFNEQQKSAFIEYIHKGGGYVGIHAASDTEFTWPWYGKFVGAYFLDHPKQQVAISRVIDKHHLATAHLPSEWQRKDEWYNFKDINPNMQVLMTLDERTYTGGKNGEQHPIAWYQNFEGGRMFYTALGHTDESYSDENFLQHVLGGLQYAMGKQFPAKK
ncbi:hypothetical protein LX64_00344 [Chitinophaga skermanii]|uniref:ThuA-like domain-containing protein n=1 Tax=Chitinophaga skermanii TaxID=331697 RepID=A0A327R9Z6_9BACT|nr:ThuA domain-containing protein [Chitinophaga skermanii]RAJ10737.1 hypothetical protein LX64_00344 [Chitinophaga skermanii]